MEIPGDPLTDDVVDICDPVDVEDRHSSEYSKGAAGFVEEDGLVDALPEVGMIFVCLKQRDLDLQILAFCLARQDGELKLLEFEPKDALILHCKVDFLNLFLSCVDEG